jgi:hypothetical protein
LSRYSQLYIERGNRLLDSERFRVRLHAIFEENLEELFGDRIAKAVKASQGIDIQSGLRRYLFGRFFRGAEIRDVLDFVTTVFDVVQNATYRKFWLESIATIFEEEHLGYRVDPEGIVHPYVDQQFEMTQRAAIEALNQDQFRQARTEFEAAFRHLRGRENIQALRMMFPAVETVAKVLFPGAFPRLTSNEVDRHIAPRMQARYVGNQPATDAANQLLAGMKNWINAAHQYRHGAGAEEPTNPPDDLVIALLSAGATYLRWIIEICG